MSTILNITTILLNCITFISGAKTHNPRQLFAMVDFDHPTHVMVLK